MEKQKQIREVLCINSGVANCCFHNQSDKGKMKGVRGKVEYALEKECWKLSFHAKNYIYHCVHRLSVCFIHGDHMCVYSNNNNCNTSMVSMSLLIQAQRCNKQYHMV